MLCQIGVIRLFNLPDQTPQPTLYVRVGWHLGTSPTPALARAFFAPGLETVVTAILFAPLIWLGFGVPAKHIPTRD